MIRRATLVSELIDYESISRDRLGDELRLACPLVVKRCDGADAPLNCRQLVELVIARLPDCHGVGVIELIVARLRWSFPDAVMNEIPDRFSVEGAFPSRRGWRVGIGDETLDRAGRGHRYL